MFEVLAHPVTYHRLTPGSLDPKGDDRWIPLNVGWTVLSPCEHYPFLHVRADIGDGEFDVYRVREMVRQVS